MSVPDPISAPAPTETQRRARPSPRRRLLVVAACAVALTLVGCGDEAGSSDGCGPVRRETLDGRSLHLIPGTGEEPRYQTDPPTSGPHVATPNITGVQEEALTRPVQVGLLEVGLVLVQHTGLSAADRATVEALAGPDVVVAPADTLPEDAAVIATAWVTKVVCGEVDAAALERFVEENRDNAPGDHG